ncbi:MAG: aspartate aminotransferase family protein, partial [Candidatus Dormibacteraeota bacterium]|nr:aspartate aminotransferase family protein [Candidatus Dormibacteraeota bacterium]
ATGLAAFWEGFGPLAPGFLHAPAPDPYRHQPGEDGAGAGAAYARRLEEVVLEAGPQTVAAVVVEPVQGAGGLIVPPPDYLPLVREVCDRHNLLLIADEVITGFGRTGRWFGLENWQVRPDLMLFAKGITSGYLPLSGVMLTGEVHRTLAGLGSYMPHGFTYSGHPVACAVALRNLQVLEEEGLVARAAAMGERLQQRLAGLRSHALVGDVRGLGLLGGVELVRDRETKELHAPGVGVARRVSLHALAEGVIVRALGGDVIALAPPFVITEDQIDQVVETLDRAIARVEAELA